jgi:ketosteroid isomerase-like protein
MSALDDFDEVLEQYHLALDEFFKANPEPLNLGFETVAKHVGPELAYVLLIERDKVKIDGSEDIAPSALRVTMVFRPEDGEWKVVHRHADPITTPQQAESVIQE